MFATFSRLERDCTHQNNVRLSGLILPVLAQGPIKML